MKQWYKSKTVWINILGLLIEVAQIGLDFQLLPVGTLTAILAVLNIFLRFITKTAIVNDN